MSRRAVLHVFLLGLLAVLLPGQPSAALRDARIEIAKGGRTLTLFSGGRIHRTYRIGLGLDPVTAKRKQGDHATPEGTYFITHKNHKSRFHLSLGISYPGPEDADRGLGVGLVTKREHGRIVAAHERRAIPPWDTRLGGEIFIHGGGSGSDWTWGCIALENAEIEELYELVAAGTTVVIRP